MTKTTHNHRHGGPWDRGSADRYYGRPRNPHYYVGATATTPLVDAQHMTADEIDEYNDGFDSQTNRREND